MVAQPPSVQVCGQLHPRFIAVHALTHLTVRIPRFNSITCGLGARSLLHDRKEIRLTLRTTAATLELGSLFDSERHVMYVAINLR